MVTWEVADRTITRRSGVVLVAVGALVPIAFAATALAGEVNAGLIALGLVIGLGLALWGWMVTQGIVAISVGADGMVLFEQGIGSFGIPAREFRSFHGQWTVDSYDPNKGEWRMQISHPAGQFSLGRFGAETLLVDAVRAHNASVRVSGIWPLGLTPGIRYSSGDWLTPSHEQWVPLGVSEAYVK